MRNTKPLLIIGIALLVAIAAVLVAAKWMGESNAASTKVVVAGMDIGQGTRLTPSNLQLVDWPKNTMPQGAITDIKQLENRIARTDIGRGEAVLESKLAPPGTLGGLSAVVSDGKRAMTVRVNDVIGVAGFALPGNYVDILVNLQRSVRDNGQEEDSISKIVLERILVLAVAQESNRDDTKPRVVNAVTLELTPDEVEKLDLARSVGSLSLVLRNQIDPAPANTIGATRASVLGEPAPTPGPKAAPKTVPDTRPAPAREPERVLVIRGLEASPQALN